MKTISVFKNGVWVQVEAHPSELKTYPPLYPEDLAKESNKKSVPVDDAEKNYEKMKEKGW